MQNVMYGGCFLTYIMQIPSVERYNYISCIKIPRPGLCAGLPLYSFLLVISAYVVKMTTFSHSSSSKYSNSE